jgi:hypothetical protein
LAFTQPGALKRFVAVHSLFGFSESWMEPASAQQKSATNGKQILYPSFRSFPARTASHSSEAKHMFIYNPHECAYCRSQIAVGQRWVREKIYESAYTAGGPHYLRYHADLFDGAEVSCWEKHRMELEIARTAARAA